MSEVEVLLLWLSHKKFTTSFTRETLHKHLPECREHLSDAVHNWKLSGLARLRAVPANGDKPVKEWSLGEELRAERVLYSQRMYSDSYLRRAESICRGRKFYLWVHLDLDAVFSSLFGDPLQYNGLTRKQMAEVLKVEKLVADRYAKWLVSNGWTEKVRRVNGTISRVLTHEDV
jgi:hypothetical protein